MPASYLSRFRTTPTAHRSTQKYGSEWMAAAHLESERRLGTKTPEELERFSRWMEKAMARYGCSADRVSERGYELPDFSHQNWEEMRVFRLDKNPAGLGAETRSHFYAERSLSALQKLFADDREAPADLLHVTCTGYVSPSAPQRLIAEKGWQNQTRLLQIYHHGCYASLPAVRSATALVNSPHEKNAGRAEVAHTELCTLHFNPSLHDPEQLVVQSLFADGLIRYTVTSTAPSGPSLAVLSTGEWIVPDSGDEMQWYASEFGFRMVLSAKVPGKIASAVSPFIDDILIRAGLPLSAREEAVYAIHPGGPRILDGLQDILKLTDSQIAASRGVLHDHGNMSSATLPHVWERLLETLPNGTPIVSLAFGPGLTIAGGVFRKEGQ